MEPQHIGACIIVKHPSGKILLGKRKNSYKSGMYGIPGGRVEVGESLDACIKRELLEETNLSAQNVSYIGVIREYQVTYDFIHFVYVCDVFTGDVTVTEPDKCEAWEWFDKNSLPHNILLAHAAAITEYFSPTRKLPFLKDILSNK